MTQSELHDQKMATLALQNVRTHRHIFEAAELSMIGAIRTAVMFGATHDDLLDIIDAEPLDRWLPQVGNDLVGHWLLVTDARDVEGAVGFDDPNAGA
jgi:hypothetical protein